MCLLYYFLSEWSPHGAAITCPFPGVEFAAPLEFVRNIAGMTLMAFGSNFGKKTRPSANKRNHWNKRKYAAKKQKRLQGESIGESCESEDNPMILTVHRSCSSRPSGRNPAETDLENRKIGIELFWQLSAIGIHRQNIGRSNLFGSCVDEGNGKKQRQTIVECICCHMLSYARKLKDKIPPHLKTSGC